MADINERAASPHELMLFNLSVIHFLLPALLFGTGIVWVSVAVPMLSSLLLISYIFYRYRNDSPMSALSRAHWGLCWRRAQYLLLSYALALLLFFVAYVLLQWQSDAPMRAIQLAIAGWFSLLPISLTVTVLLILETSALAQSRRGIMPENMQL
jgi:hypothetical protein